MCDVTPVTEHKRNGKVETANKSLAQKRLSAGLIQIMELVKLLEWIIIPVSTERLESAFTRSSCKRAGDENGFTVERSGGSFTPVCTRPAGAPGFVEICGQM